MLEGWRRRSIVAALPQFTHRHFLAHHRVQLDNPNLADPAQREAYEMLKTDPAKYKKRVRELATAYAREHNA